MFGVIEAERTINGKTSFERRLYIGSIAPEASVLANAVYLQAKGGEEQQAEQFVCQLHSGG